MKLVKARDALKHEVERAQQIIDQYRDQQRIMRDPDVRREVARVARAARGKHTGLVGIEVSPYSNEVVIRLGIEGLDGFTGRQCAGFLERLEGKLGLDWENSADYADQGHRAFYSAKYGQLNLPSAGRTVKSFKVAVSAFIKADAKNCRKVLIGEDSHTYTSARYAFLCN